MNQDPVLNLDLDDGILYIEDASGVKYPVQTSSRIDPMSLLMEDGQYLKAKDFENNWLYITDASGEKVSLKGERGPQGIPGDPGQDAPPSYHLELSDDVDQLFVTTDYKTVSELAYNIMVNVFKDGQKISDLGAHGLSIKSERSSSALGNYSWYDSNEQLYYISIPKDYIVNNEEFVFTLKLINNTTNLVLSAKNFRLKRIQGTTDYDLHITPGYIKLDSKSDALIVQIKKRELLLNHSSFCLISPSLLPPEYKLEYYLNGLSSRYDLETDFIDLSDMSLSEDSVVCVELKYNDQVIDKSYIECIKDGSDGAPSYYLDLSNDYDQLYYNNNRIIPNQTDFESVITFYKGVDKQNLDASNSTVTITSPWNNKGEYSISYDAGSINLTIDWDKVDLSDLINNGKIPNQIEYKILIQSTAYENNVPHIVDLLKFIKIAVVHGVDDYDIQLEKTTASKDKNGVLKLKQAISVDVYHTRFGVDGVQQTIKSIDNLGSEGLALWYSVDGGNPALLASEMVPTSVLQEAEDNVKILLLKGQDILDYAIIDIMYDGQDGSDSLGYSVSLSNDNGLINVLDGELIFNTISTEVRVFKNGRLQNTDNYDIRCALNGATLEGVWERGDTLDFWIFTYSFDSVPTQEQSEFVFTITFEQGSIVKVMRVKKIEGETRYTLNVPDTLTLRSNRTFESNTLWVTAYKETILDGSVTSEPCGDGYAIRSEYIEQDIYEDGKWRLDLSQESVADDVNLLNIILILKKDLSQLDSEYINLVTKEPGEAALHVELSNDMDSVPVGSDGKVSVTTRVSTTVSVYKGTQLATEEYSVVAHIGTKTLEVPDGIFSYNFTLGTTPGNIIFDVYDEHDSLIAQKTFKIIPIKGNVRYSLLCTPSVFVCDENGNPKDSSIKIQILKAETNKTPEVLSKIPTGFSITVGSDTYNSGETLPDSITVTTGMFTNNSLKIELKLGSLIIDSESIGKITDGTNGKTPSQLICTSGNVYTFYVNAEKKPLANNVQTVSLSWRGIDSQGNNTTVTSGLDSTFGSGLTSSNFTAEATKLALKSGATIEPGSYTITYTHSTYGTSVITVNIVMGAMSYDLKCTPGYIKKSSNGDYSSIEFSVYSECSGGGYHEETTSNLTDGSGLTLWITGVSGDDSMITGSNDGKIIYKPDSDRLTTFKLRNGKDKNGPILDFLILTDVKDGAGFIDSFPATSKLGDTYVWGGESGENTSCLLGHVLLGLKYRYVALTAPEKLYIKPLQLYWKPPLVHSYKAVEWEDALYVAILLLRIFPTFTIESEELLMDLTPVILVNYQNGKAFVGENILLPFLDDKYSPDDPNDVVTVECYVKQADMVSLDKVTLSYLWSGMGAYLTWLPVDVPDLGRFEYGKVYMANPDNLDT